MRKARLFLLSPWIFFCLSACLPSEQGPKTFFGLGSKISIVTPPDFKEMPELHTSADIRAGDEKSDAYLLVVSERREILPKGQSLAQYSEYIRNAYVGPLQNVQQFGPWNASVKGRIALRYEIRYVSSGGVPIVTLHTVVESPDYFHQIVLWTHASRYAKNQTMMRQIADSFVQK